MSCIQFFSAGVFNTALALIFESPIAFPSLGDAILPVLYLGIVSSGIAYTLQIIGQRDVAPATASIILSLESVFGVIAAAIFGGADMTAREYAGCAIVFVAVILSQVDPIELIKKHRAKKGNAQKG